MPDPIRNPNTAKAQMSMSREAVVSVAARPRDLPFPWREVCEVVWVLACKAPPSWFGENAEAFGTLEAFVKAYEVDDAPPF